MTSYFSLYDVAGVDHQELVSMADSSLSSVREGLSTDEETCLYNGGQNLCMLLDCAFKLVCVSFITAGGEVLTPTRAGLTHAAMVSRGARCASCN